MSSDLAVLPGNLSEKNSPASPSISLGLIDQLLSVAEDVGCNDLPGLKEALERGAFAQRSLVAAVLDSGMVAERDFLF